MQDLLKVAMPKGRIYKQASKLFREAGLAIPEDADDSRKLIIAVPEARMEFIMAKRSMYPLTSSTALQISELSARMC